MLLRIWDFVQNRTTLYTLCDRRHKQVIVKVHSFFYIFLDAVVHYLNKCKKGTDTKDSLPRVACLRYGAGPETFAKFRISDNIVLCMYNFFSTFK